MADSIAHLAAEPETHEHIENWHSNPRWLNILRTKEEVADQGHQYPVVNTVDKDVLDRHCVI
jgi:hypothetical protein